MSSSCSSGSICCIWQHRPQYSAARTQSLSIKDTLSCSIWISSRTHPLYPLHHPNQRPDSQLHHHLYADDTQVYTSLTPTLPQAIYFQKLMYDWKSSKINPDKTEFIVIDTLPDKLSKLFRDEFLKLLQKKLCSTQAWIYLDASLLSAKLVISVYEIFADTWIKRH